jgi:hypothetical protein
MSREDILKAAVGFTVVGLRVVFGVAIYGPDVMNANRPSHLYTCDRLHKPNLVQE